MYLYKLEFSLDICPGVGLEDNTRNSVSSFLKDLHTAFHRESESEVAQSCPILCYPMDCSPPGSSVHGILQARVLEWVAISFSRGSSRPRDRTQVSHIAGRRFNLWATREAPGDQIILSDRRHMLGSPTSHLCPAANFGTILWGLGLWISF